MVVVVSSKLGAHYSFLFLHNIYDVNGQHKCNVIYVLLAAATATAAVTIDDIYPHKLLHPRALAQYKFTNYTIHISSITRKKIDQISETRTFYSDILNAGVQRVL